MAKQRINNSQQNNPYLTATNTGTAGGTWYYQNVGGMKKAIITTGNLASSASGGQNYTFIPPSGFFTTVLAANAVGVNQTIAGEQYVNISNTPSPTLVGVRSLAPSSATQAISLILEGV